LIRTHTVRRIALTGGIATGKSYVRHRFAALGVPTLDSDDLARQAVEPGTPSLAAVIDRFGSHVVDASGRLDRKKMAEIVFSDPEARRALESIIHPEVRNATDAWFARIDPESHPIAIADIPLLYEVNRDRDFDQVIVAACRSDTQIERLRTRDGMSEAEARRRIEAQLPIDEKVKRADFVISTDGSFEQTERQVKDVFRTLNQ
jgi:dephospho-CoA kinase